MLRAVDPELMEAIIKAIKDGDVEGVFNKSGELNAEDDEDDEDFEDYGENDDDEDNDDNDEEEDDDFDSDDDQQQHLSSGEDVDNMVRLSTACQYYAPMSSIIMLMGTMPQNVVCLYMRCCMKVDVEGVDLRNYKLLLELSIVKSLFNVVVSGFLPKQFSFSHNFEKLEG